MTGKLKEEDTSSVLGQVNHGDQGPVDHGHHLGLVQEAVELHAQEDPESVGCQGRGH
jgi:hypothetical protein